MCRPSSIPVVCLFWIRGPINIDAGMQLLRFIGCVATIIIVRFTQYLSATEICVFDFKLHFSSGYADDDA
jgi:hypothetical protein